MIYYIQKEEIRKKGSYMIITKIKEFWEFLEMLYISGFVLPILLFFYLLDYMRMNSSGRWKDFKTEDIFFEVI